ncbi:MAG: PQQ-dependent dehydrogenase, methanol/ethanol family, partial [Pseudomonadales bacterium]
MVAWLTKILVPWLVAGIATAQTAQLDENSIINADAQPHNWLSHGRTYDEQRFSPLKKINKDNVGDLGLAWFFTTDDKQGLQATPLVIDGVMYVTASWSV